MATKKRRPKKHKYIMPKLLDPIERLRAIAEIIDDVDNRTLAADGAVSRFQDEVTNAELNRIYRLATAPLPLRRSRGAAMDRYEPSADSFTRGYAVAVAAMQRHQVDGARLLREANIGLAELKQAQVMEFDLEHLRPLLRRK